MSEIMLVIGGLRLRLSLLSKPRVDKAFCPFVAETDKIWDVAVDYRLDETLSDAEVSVSQNGDYVTVRYPKELSYRFVALRGCLMHVPMEQILLLHNRFFLHSSFVASPWGGLLFTGDSGVGKSTQAELWREHRNSEIINGDRAIVAKEEDGWRAYGSPYAGSSGYFVRADAPVRAIILLEQAQENQATVVSPPEAFKKLFLQISLNHSDSELVNRLCDLLTELVYAVPVYRLRCTPDVRAVQALEEMLRKGELHETG